ncbi:MAG: hypothetical protein IPP28_00070 [Xanthomonadales bacterium]|nr:hypothetical protein [Xanthomonadales bacterium]
MPALAVAFGEIMRELFDAAAPAVQDVQHHAATVQSGTQVRQGRRDREFGAQDRERHLRCREMAMFGRVRAPQRCARGRDVQTVQDAITQGQALGHARRGLRPEQGERAGRRIARAHAAGAEQPQRGIERHRIARERLRFRQRVQRRDADIGRGDHIEARYRRRRIPQAPDREWRQRCVGEHAQGGLADIDAVDDARMRIEHDQFDVGGKLREQRTQPGLVGLAEHGHAERAGMGHGVGRCALWVVR